MQVSRSIYEFSSSQLEKAIKKVSDRGPACNRRRHHVIVKVCNWAPGRGIHAHKLWSLIAQQRCRGLYWYKIIHCRGVWMRTVAIECERSHGGRHSLCVNSHRFSCCWTSSVAARLLIGPVIWRHREWDARFTWPPCSNYTNTTCNIAAAHLEFPFSSEWAAYRRVQLCL